MKFIWSSFSRLFRPLRKNKPEHLNPIAERQETSVEEQLVQLDNKESKLSENNKEVISGSFEKTPDRSDFEINVKSEEEIIGFRTYREIITNLIASRSEAKTGFTSKCIYTWLHGELSIKSISKTLYKMKTYGLIKMVDNHKSLTGNVYVINK